MQKSGVRGEIEFLGQPKPGSARGKPDGPKKSWANRHPIVCGIIVAGIASAVAFSNIHGCEGKHEKEGGALIKKTPLQEMREQQKKDRVEKLKRIRQIIEVQRKLIESGWVQNHEEREKLDEEREEDGFRAEIEKLTKDDLIELLIKQGRVIGQLRDEYRQVDSDTAEEVQREISMEEGKRVVIQDKIDEIEIDERGLMNKSAEELEDLIRELDQVIMEQENYPVMFGEYWEITSERTLIAKALEEKKFWEDILVPPSG